MNWDKNWKFLIGLKIKKKFWVFQLSNLAVYPRLETLKSQKLCLTPVLTLAVIQDSKTPKNKLRRKLFRFRYDLGKKEHFWDSWAFGNESTRTFLRSCAISLWVKKDHLNWEFKQEILLKMSVTKNLKCCWIIP